MSTWLIYSILGGLLSNGTTFTNRVALKGDADPTAYAWWFEVIRTVIFLLILPFDFSLEISWTALFHLLSIGAIEVVSVYIFMRMFATNELSVSTLIGRLRLIWAPLFATLFLGEILSPHHYFGIACIFVGALATTSLKNLRFDKGIHYAFAFGLISALLNITMKTSSTVASTPVVMIASAIPSIFILPLLMKNSREKIKKSFQNRFKHNTIATLFNVIAMYLFIEAYRLAEVGLVFSVFNSMAIVAVLAGIIFLGERDRIPAKIIGSIISVFGIFLLA